MNHIQSPANSDEAIEHQIIAKGLTAPRVTPDQIKELKARVLTVVEYFHTSTLAHAFLDGEFYLCTGHSACVSLKNYNKEIGDRLAAEDMNAKVDKMLWLLEGYALRKQLHDMAQIA